LCSTVGDRKPPVMDGKSRYGIIMVAALMRPGITLSFPGSPVSA
jgi:hypothetical protein